MSSLRGLNISRTMEPMVLVRTSHNFFNEILETWIQKEIMQKSRKYFLGFRKLFFALKSAIPNFERLSWDSYSHETGIK